MEKQLSTNQTERLVLMGELIQVLRQRRPENKLGPKEEIFNLRGDIIKISSEAVAAKNLENATPDYRKGFWAGYQHRCEEMQAYKKASDEFINADIRITS